jgi:hypothetical protein
MVWARAPWRVAFWEEAALPSGVFGQVERFALARLAVICLGLPLRGNGSWQWAGILLTAKWKSLKVNLIKLWELY